MAAVSTSSVVSSSSSSAGPGGGLWAFYYIQGEDGEDRSHPNAFKIPSVGDVVTLADVHRYFPLPNPGAFHFRFRINASVKSGATFFWLDITNPTQKVPLVNGRVICKLLRLHRPQPPGLVFRRKPVLKWTNESSSSTSNGSFRGEVPGGGLSRQSSANANANANAASAVGARPARYTDSPGPGPGPSTDGGEPPLSRSASATGGGGGNGSGSGSSSRTGSGSAAAKVEHAPAAPQESFEDFLSGGQGAGAPAKASDVNLMSDDSAWSDNPRTPQKKANAASDFLSSMDPLAQQQPAGNGKNMGRGGGGAAAAAARTEPPKFDDDPPQTVGPVKLADMQKYAVSADGSNVYNPKFVDKSTKSEDVRRAMEQRERQIQMDVEKAREELRQREEAKNQMNAMKENANAILGPKLKAWAEDNGRVKNIRTLLSTMHQVMWEDSKWAEVNMGKLIQPNDIKRNYRKAMLVVHPDKSPGRNAEQLLIAERVFAALNTAWDEFMKTNPC